jgi:hypothetical protein
MLEIVSSKGALELAPNEEIAWEEIFHVINQNADLKSWRFNLPKSAKNKAQLASFIDIDAKRRAEISLEIEVLLFGQEWSRGPLFFLDENESAWEVSFAGKMGYLLLKLSDLSLQKFTYPDANPVDIYDHALTVNSQVNSDYVFAPLDLPSLQGEVWWPAQINSVVVNDNGDLDRFVEFWRHFEEDDWSDTTQYNELDRVRFNKFYYEALTGTLARESPDTHPAKWQQITQGPIKRYNPMVPFLKVFKILQHIATEKGFSLSGELMENAEIQQLVFFNTVCLNTMEENVPGTVLPNTIIEYKRHIPDIEVVALLREIALLFNQRIDYSNNDNTLRFIPRSASLKSPIGHSLRDKVIRMEVIHREKRTYHLKYGYLQSDAELASSTWTGSLEGIESELGSETLNSSFSTLAMRYGFNEVDPAWREYPGDSRMDANYPGFWWRPASSLTLNADVPQQFLLWRKFHYYLAGSWDNDPELPQVSSDLSFSNFEGYNQTLLWKGSGGLYEVHWEEFLYTLSLAKVLRVFFLLDGQSWNRSQLLGRQSLREWICLLETVKLNIKQDDQSIIAEAQVLKM